MTTNPLIRWLSAVAAEFVAFSFMGFDPDFPGYPDNWNGTSCKWPDVRSTKQGDDVGLLAVGLKQHKLWLDSNNKQGSQLNLFNKKLDGADLSEQKNLSGAKLSAVSLDSADLTASNFKGADFSSASLELADTSNSKFDNANFSDASLRRADLSGSSFESAALHGADLYCADLRGAHPTNADLGCYFDNSERCADLRQVDFRGANLANAVFDFSTLAGAIFEPEVNPKCERYRLGTRP
jgi:hypothetical protein